MAKSTTSSPRGDETGGIPHQATAGDVQQSSGFCLDCDHFDRGRSWCKKFKSPTTPDYGCEDFKSPQRGK